MSQTQATTTVQGIFAMLTLGLIINVIYAGFLHFTGSSIDIFTPLTSAPYFFNLEIFNKNLALTQYTGVLAHSMLYSGIMLTCTLTIAITIFHFKCHISKKMEATPTKKNTEILSTNGFLTIKSDNAKIVLKVKRYIEKEQKYNTQTISDPFPEIYMKMKRSQLKMSRAPKTPIEQLEAALINILHFHRSYPADPNGYHADVSIYMHSLDVAEKLYKESSQHRLSRVIGLAHDIGKILTYKKNIDTKGKIKWSILSKQHDTLSAQIVRMLPEFELLSDQDKSTISTVLSYSHKPDRMPKRHTSQTEILLVKHLRECDGLATKEDRQSITDLISDPNTIKELAKALKMAILLLNINAIRDGYADGWTSDLRTFVGIKENILREKLIGYLPQKLTRALGLVIEQRNHPATPIIIQALQKDGFYMGSYDGYTPSNGLFSVKVGTVSFHGIILLERNVLEEEMPEIVESWGNCDHKFKVIHLGQSQNDNQT